ncbi:MAG: SH3 domain-containing protein [Novosphingobium sp.]
MGAAAIPTGQLSLSGPSEKLDAAHWPVRGDLAHIALAGRVFVPHYAVPMPRVLARDAEVKQAAAAQAETLESLSAGACFDVLDIAGGWAWGQVGMGGCVGYLPLDALEQ